MNRVSTIRVPGIIQNFKYTQIFEFWNIRILQLPFIQNTHLVQLRNKSITI